MGWFEFACPACKKTIRADEAWAGSETTCPECGGKIVIPGKEAEAVAPPPPPAGVPAPGAGSRTPEPEAVRTPFLSFVDRLASSLRFVETRPRGYDLYQLILTIVGVYAILVAGILFLVQRSAAAIKTDSLTVFLLALLSVPVALVLHHVAARFGNAGQAMLRDSEHEMFSSAFLDCLGLITLLAAVTLLFVGIRDSIRSGGVAEAPGPAITVPLPAPGPGGPGPAPFPGPLPNPGQMPLPGPAPMPGPGTGGGVPPLGAGAPFDLNALPAMPAAPAAQPAAASAANPLWEGLFNFFILAHLALFCFNPKGCLNIRVVPKQATPGETALSILVFLCRCVLATAPIVLGLGVLGGTIWIIVATIRTWSTDLVAGVQVHAAAFVVVTAAVAPFVLYIVYLLTMLAVGLLSAVFQIEQNTRPKAE